MTGQRRGHPTRAERDVDVESGRPRVAYLMSRFPKLSETFVLNEIRAVERCGVDCELFPLIREHEDVAVARSEEYVRRAHYQPAVSPRILLSGAAWLVERPIRSVSTIAIALAGVLGSRKFTVGLLGLLPKTLHNARVARELGVDHLHAHFAHHPAMAAWIVSRLTGIPYSFTAHGHDVQVERRMLCRKIHEAAFVFTISRHNQSLMAAACPAQSDRIEVLHSGVDTEELSPGPASAAFDDPWTPGRTRILSVGRLEPVKAHAQLVLATRHAVDAGLDLDVAIVGEGPERATIERLVREHDVADRVHLLGARPHEDVVELMRDADVVVLPSTPTADGRVEGIPIVLMEAMSLGIPVAASRLPGVVELVGEDHPLLFEAGDATGMAAVLERLSSDESLAAELARAGRERVCASFDIQATGCALADRFRANRAPTTPVGPTG